VEVSPPHSSAIFFAGSSMALTASLNLPISATQSGPWFPQDVVQVLTSATKVEVLVVFHQFFLLD